MPTHLRPTPFDGYLGRIVLYEDRFYFVKEARIGIKAVKFIIRNEVGDERKISTKALLDGLLEEVEPRIYKFSHSG
jgi:hypothetical protein